MNIITWLENKKTYIMAGLLFVYAAAGYMTGHLTVDQALGLLWTSGVVSSLRAAIAKLQTP